MRAAGVEEQESGDPTVAAASNARRKAAAVPAALTLGADTVVALDGEIYGKPADEAQAREFLGRLAGREHEVLGGLALAEHGDVVAADVEVTRVRFRPLSAAWLDWYVGTGEWRERAGGYAIQGAGAALVRAIDGDYLNVVGLPLARLLELRPALLP